MDRTWLPRLALLPRLAFSLCSTLICGTTIVAGQVSVASSALAAPSAASPLTDIEVEQAVARGYTNKQHPIGTRVQSVDTGDFAGTGCRHCGETVFTATLYTAPQWIEAQAFAAKQAKKPFTPSDVPAAMRQPVLYVIAQEIKNDLDLTANATDIGFRGIQLADEAQKIKVEPLMHKFTQQSGAPGSGLTGNVTTATATSVFSVVSARSILDQDKGDFWIVLTLPSGQKFLKVKASAVRAAL